MAAIRRRLSALEQLYLLQASGADYLLLAAATAIPLYSSGAAIQEPLIGIMFVALTWSGLLISYVIRRFTPGVAWIRHTAWLQLGAAAVVGVNLNSLNSLLPGEGFPWQLFPLAFLCWFVVIGSYFLWTDGALYFQAVPGIALFGLISWLETSAYFDVAVVLFMVTVAVLLTRLHTRVMYARSRAAGYEDFYELRRGPWKAMAGPTLAIISVLVVAGVSKLASPHIGGAMMNLAPTIEFTPPPLRPNPLAGVRVDRMIGNGPTTSTNLRILRVETTGNPTYLRAHAFQRYRGLGWTEISSTQDLEPTGEEPSSNIANAEVYRPPPRYSIAELQVTRTRVESLARRHVYVYSPGTPVRIEYEGSLRIDRQEFPIFGDSFPSGRTYAVSAATPPQPSRELRDAPQADRAAQRDLYGRTDIIHPDVRDLAESVIRGTASDYDAAMAIMREVGERCSYNLQAERISGSKDRVQAFLFETREGYCDLFASAVAVMCRSVGIPARMADGFLLDSESMDGDAYIVRDRHAHLWAEVYFDGYGWVPFDATGIADSVPGAGVGALLGDSGKSMTLRWTAWAAGIVFALIFVLLTASSGLSWYKTRNRLSPPLRRLRPLYLAYLRILRKEVQRPKAPSETTLEYAEAYRSAIGDGVVAIELAEAFDQALYAQPEPTEAQIRFARERVTEMAAAARKKNGR
ncbi:MAG: DUF4129 domain-containing protein [Armatimonadetes bacterium]|nr:DUF4129 domain-containing protein [Armatimonadota bacterium]